MKIKLLILLFILNVSNIKAQYSKVECVSTTETEKWESHQGNILKKSTENVDVELLVHKRLQTIEGFGACFNELGWTSLNFLSEKDRTSIFKELFAINYGANFTICRMPVGANDFSRDWYSYNETDGDFAMNNFSISNDLETLVPFIKLAQNYNPKLKIWASPWSPPTWMKWNKHYACRVSKPELDEKFKNDLDKNKQGKEGTNMFIQKDNYFTSYALYFSKFVAAYRKQGIAISTIMPQNEFNSCQIFPSCTWTALSLSKFIGDYLGPEMKKQKVEIMFGTMERPSRGLVDTIFSNPRAKKYVKGVGFQWAGKTAIPEVYKNYPKLKLYQTEQECGDGNNDWKYCCYTWDLMKHYFKNGVSAYMYWNISLEKGGFSRWGWQQNSLVTVDANAKTYQYNYEYYLLKHLSHYVKPGAKLISTSGHFSNLLAFINLDNSIVVVLQNDTNVERKINMKLGKNTISLTVKPSSFNTAIIN